MNIAAGFHRKPILFTAAFALIAASHTFAQISIVEDINPGEGGSGEFVAGALGTKIFFKADDGTVVGRELYWVDGAALGSVSVQDIWPITNDDINSWWSSEPGDFTAAGGSIYFTASEREDPSTNQADFELWYSNGSTASSLDIWAGTTSSGPTSLVEMGGALYLFAYDETYGRELHKASGGSASVVKDIEPNDGNALVLHEIFSVDLSNNGSTDTLFFFVFDADTGYEPWISDGTDGGTGPLKDVRPGEEDSNASDFIGFLGKAWFRADDGTNGTELWVTDGTESGTTLFLDIDPTGSGSPSSMTPVGNQLFFTATNGTDGFELWVSDGVDVGSGGTTEMVADLTDGVGSSFFNNLTAFGSILAFTFDNGTNGTELWFSDGTAQNTGMVKDIWEGSSSSSVGNLTVANGLLFFGANDGSLGRELWVSDGTTDGTLLVCDVGPDWSVEGPTGLTVAGDKLFFQTNSSAGRELHVVDTTDIVTPPTQPTVTGSLHTETTLTFTTGGSVSLKGADVQYRFYWEGDDVYSDWLDVGVTSADHSWDEAGTYSVHAEARSASNPSTVLSCPSSDREIVLTFNETIAVPDVSGSTDGGVGETLEFAVVGESSLGHPLEYKVVTWGDGDGTDWTDLDSETNTVDLSHAWDSAGTHNVQIHIRCREHTDAINWVDFDVEISGDTPETISVPVIDGPETGGNGISHSYTISAESSAGHNLQYRIDWNDGNISDWTSFGAGLTSVQVAHTWQNLGDYDILVRVRCADHTTIENEATLTVSIQEETIENVTLSGPANGYTNHSYTYTISGESTWGHDLEYAVSWGDGTPDIDWTPFPTGATTVEVTHAWDFEASDFPMWAGIRCATHTGLEGGDDMLVAITDGPAGLIFADGFETGDSTQW